MIIFIFVSLLFLLFSWLYFNNPHFVKQKYNRDLVYNDDMVVISPQTFYGQYFGHPIDELSSMVKRAHENNHSIAWLVGDSSLDNKHWLFNDIFEKNIVESITVVPHKVYKHMLVPPICIPDVAACLNDKLKETNYIAINCAVEESNLFVRENNNLLAHDKIAKNNMGPNDLLIVSVGGNDVGLNPCVRTLFWLAIMYLLPLDWVPPHVYDLFHTQLKRYLSNLTKVCVPKDIIVCMFYYPCAVGHGWLDKSPVFKLYKRNPEKMKRLIDLIFEKCISTIEIEGATVYPIHLGHVLDCSDPDDYVSRVEPSKRGGEKMAQAFYDKIF